jgi:hypothetical protein
MARERRRHHRRHDQDSPEDDLHAQILEVLLDLVRSDTYPSTTHLDIIESLLRDDESDQYAEILLEKVRGDAYPSFDHLQRLMKFA